MKERMTVREILTLFGYGTHWMLIGGRTGKKLCTSYSSAKTREKYMDFEVTSESPLRADFYVPKSEHFTQFIVPMICIWVSGE